MAIVGAGASGALTAINLLRAARPDRGALRVLLIDRRASCGGVAYSTNDPRHRLNVPAGLMSAFPDAPEDFVDWRARRGGDGDPCAYAPRSEFRNYLEDTLAQAQATATPHATLNRLVGDVVALEPGRHQTRVLLADGSAFGADAAVLAIGNLAAVPVEGCDTVLTHPRYIADPWTPGALDRVGEPGRSVVMLIGSGLTTVDVALTLAERGHHMLAVSRGGLLPESHPSGDQGRCAPLDASANATSLTAAVDAALAQADAGDPRWYASVDRLRPDTQALWQRLSLEDRQRFMTSRHRAWSVRRHRMAPQVADALRGVLATDQLRLRRAAVEQVSARPDELDVTLTDGKRLLAGFVINCTGPGLDPRRSNEPLVRQLLDGGHARAHPVGLGFDTFAGVLRASETERLYTLGPPRMGELYETTAVPEIRTQAAELAAHLTELLAARTGDSTALRRSA